MPVLCRMLTCLPTCGSKQPHPEGASRSTFLCKFFCVFHSEGASRTSFLCEFLCLFCSALFCSPRFSLSEKSILGINLYYPLIGFVPCILFACWIVIFLNLHDRNDFVFGDCTVSYVFCGGERHQTLVNHVIRRPQHSRCLGHESASVNPDMLLGHSHSCDPELSSIDLEVVHVVKSPCRSHQDAVGARFLLSDEYSLDTMLLVPDFSWLMSFYIQ